MEVVKTVLKIIVGLAVGVLIGLVIGGGIGLLLKGGTPSEFISKLLDIDLLEGAGVILAGIAGFIVSLFLLVILHEGGHLVCGLLSGYRFVSFRVFNLTLMRDADNRLRLKRFSVAGTGGQCLLSPPDLPLEDIPVTLYNLGGIIANVLALIIALPFLWADLSPLATDLLFIFMITDIFLILMNGIPMQAGGIGNDAYNIRLLRREPESKRALIIQLRSNAMIQNGVRPKDMPHEWFKVPEKIDYRNPLEVSLPIMEASRLLDMMEWQNAYNRFNALYAHKDEIMPLYVKEIACELAFSAMITGRIQQAENLLDKDLMKYIGAYRKVMTSKERLLCSIALYIDNDRAKAETIYKRVLADSPRYLLQGEVKSDLAIMESMLDSTPISSAGTESLPLPIESSAASQKQNLP